MHAVHTLRFCWPGDTVEKDYTFDGPNGSVTLLDLFEGRPQLIIYHAMFDPAWDEGCSSCSLLIDNIGHLAHLHCRRTTLALVSRAPYEKLEGFKARMGWSCPCYSSFGSDFNYDFHVTLDQDVAPVEYNFRDLEELEAAGMGYLAGGGEQPGTSVFLTDGDRVFHTYSTYARGGEVGIGTYHYLDLTPLGRQETGPGGEYINTFRLHDTYPPDYHDVLAQQCAHCTLAAALVRVDPADPFQGWLHREGL